MRVQGSGSGDGGLGFRVECSGCRVQGLGLRVCRSGEEDRDQVHLHPILLVWVVEFWVLGRRFLFIYICTDMYKCLYV